MKALIVIAILMALGLIALMYKREKNLQKMLFSLFILLTLVGFSVVGNVMRSVMPLFLTHIVALILSYIGLIYYLFRDRVQWLLWLLPLFTLLLYVFIAWVGNEHISF
jgi:uncharacterized membrane protein